MKSLVKAREECCERVNFVKVKRLFKTCFLDFPKLMRMSKNIWRYFHIELLQLTCHRFLGISVNFICVFYQICLLFSVASRNKHVSWKLLNFVFFILSCNFGIIVLPIWFQHLNLDLVKLECLFVTLLKGYYGLHCIWFLLKWRLLRSSGEPES